MNETKLKGTPAAGEKKDTGSVSTSNETTQISNITDSQQRRNDTGDKETTTESTQRIIGVPLLQRKDEGTGDETRKARGGTGRWKHMS